MIRRLPDGPRGLKDDDGVDMHDDEADPVLAALARMEEQARITNHYLRQLVELMQAEAIRSRDAKDRVKPYWLE